MGNVGNIEKVMVFGILVIILGILGVAVMNNNKVDVPENVTQAPANAGSSFLDSDSAQKLLRHDEELDRGAAGSDDGGSGAEILPAEDELPPDDGGAAPLDVTKRSGAPPGVASDESPLPKSLPKTYKVKKGDTLERIAIDLWGDKARVADLRRANNNLNPKKLLEGMILNVPQDGVAAAPAQVGLAATPKKPVAADAGAAAKGTAPKPSPGVRTYTVKSGDTLTSISRAFYGTPHKVADIVKANPTALKDPDKLYAGLVLSIP